MNSLEQYIPMALTLLLSFATAYLTVHSTALKNAVNIANLSKRLDKLENDCCGDGKHVAERLTHVETTVAHVKESVREGFELLRQDMKSITHEIHSINKNFKHERTT